MKTVTTLLNATENKALGNHRMAKGISYKGERTRCFFYYRTMICYVMEEAKTFAIDASHGTNSTTRACNAYREQLLAQGYTEVEMKINL
jgi:hypothetical protein